MALVYVKKRSGKLERFDRSKIEQAILKALVATKSGNAAIAEKLTADVVKRLQRTFARKIPSVENIQDAVEEALMTSGFTKAAKAYILYRKKRAEVRAAKLAIVGVPHEELKLSTNAIAVLEKRYLLRDMQGRIIETPVQLFRRVAKAVAAIDSKYGENPKKSEKVFYTMMANRWFMPNTPTLMNAGTPIGQLSACFVLPVEDSLDSIFKTLWDSAKVHQTGGGTGFSFSKLRPKGDLVGSTKGVASGPVTFMTIFDKETDVIKQGGKRRGANMGILRVDHPDIVEFITAKSDPTMLRNFNISVAVTDKFMRAVKRNGLFELINPRTKKVVRRVKARELWELIITYAWKTGDPGVIFIDTINRKNPTKHVGTIEATNPCGEQPLHPYESCNLGSINLGLMTKPGKKGWHDVDWEKLRQVVHDAVHFLDNVIDANKYPIPEIEQVTKANRRIGLGVMGFADLLCLLGIPYDSMAAVRLGERIAKFINDESHKASSELAKKRGNFPNFKGSLWEKNGWKAMRNATTTTIAPTGTISIIAGCSSGIEPLFAVSFVRNVLEGSRLFESNWVFEKVATERGFWKEELMEKIARTGSVRGVPGVPKDVQRVFVTALEIVPEWHVRMQAAFQNHCDNAVSKTINFPMEATVDDVRKAYELAYQLKCKGITVYRYGSKPEQVLTIGELERKREAQTTAPPFVVAESEFSGGCPTPLCPAPA
ncbi:MAG: vitamin B12-dependent ribonucleotide reductase [Candidatus Woesearchaeota archaeon]